MLVTRRAANTVRAHPGYVLAGTYHGRMTNAQSKRTHCPRGHPYAGDNLYIDRTGRRHCRTCRKEQSRASHRRRAPAVKKKGGVQPTPWRERFWQYVTPGRPDECWEWQGARNAHGYGRLNRGGRGSSTLKAHRASYEIHHGVEPGDLDVCHTCDNPPCVNPAHLFLGDAKANAADMMAKGRGNYFAGRSAKLSDAQVRELRERAAEGESYAVLGADYGILPAYAGGLANGHARRAAGGPITKRKGGRKRKPPAGTNHT